jgi:glucosamine 6-phosphate synthetase-like amidotransferase/phosphosugar isomerase protein
MNELMLQEMNSQADTLAEAIADLRVQAKRIKSQRPRHIVLTGSGDSGYAAVAVEDLFYRRLSVSAIALPSMSAARFARSAPRGLTVPISVSGEVIRTIEAARNARALGDDTIAVVANPGSTLASTCDGALVMPKPITRATPHTRDYTATLLALGVLGEFLSGTTWNDLDVWVRAVGPLVEEALVWAAGITVPDAAVRMWFLGSGSDRGTAAYGALKFWEAGGELSWWDDLEEFAHGSQLQARPGDDVIVFATGRARSRAIEMIPGLHRMELRVFAIADTAALDGLPASHQFVLPPQADAAMVGYYSCIPVQAITYAYATTREIDVTIPMGGAPFGQTYEDVHNEWMRKSRIESQDPAQGPAG